MLITVNWSQAPWRQHQCNL